MSRSASHIEVALVYGAACGFAQAPLWRLYFLFCHANEIYLSFFVAVWLVAAAVGALLARPLPTSFAPWLALFPAASPLISSIAVYPLVSGGVQGVVPTLACAVAIATLLAAPSALASGALFSLLARRVGAAKLYALESAGFAAASLIVDLLILPHYGNAAALILAGAASLWLVLRLSPHLYITITFSALALILSLTANMAAFALLISHHQGKFLSVSYTSAGPVVRTRQRNGETLYLSGSPVVPPDLVASITAPLVRPPVLVIAQNPRPFKKAFENRGIKRFVALSLEPALAPFVDAQPYEPRCFLTDTQSRFRSAVVCLSAPTTVAAGRFVNRSFFRLLRRRADFVIVALAAPSGMVTAAYRDFAASVLRAFGKPLFLNYQPMIGIVLISNRPLGGAEFASRSFTGSVSRSNAPAATILNLASQRAGITYSMLEVAGYAPIFLRSAVCGWIVWAVFVAFCLFWALRRQQRPCAILTAGAASTFCHLSVFAAIQLRLGMLYALLATVSALFMVGVAVGALIRRGTLFLSGPAGVAFLFAGLLTEGYVCGAFLLAASFCSGAALGVVFANCAREGSVAFALDMGGAVCGLMLFMLLLLHGFLGVGVALAGVWALCGFSLIRATRATGAT